VDELGVLRNPRAGVVEPDDPDYAAVLEIATPYLGDVIQTYINA